LAAVTEIFGFGISKTYNAMDVGTVKKFLI
jgi:hypothetical protein